MNKLYLFLLLIIVYRSNCFAQEHGGDSVAANSFQLTVSISPTFQVFTDKRGKITGNAFSIEFPALTLYYHRLMLSATATYGSGTSNVDITTQKATFTTKGGYLNFFQYKMLCGYSVLKTKFLRITPYGGIMFAELIGEKNLGNRYPDYNSVRLFPNYTLGATAEYDLTSKNVFERRASGKAGLRHYLRLNVAYNFLDTSTTNRGNENFGLPQRVMDIGIGWGVFLVE